MSTTAKTFETKPATAANIYADGAAYIDGEFTPMAQARIPVLDWGFTRSDCTYDVVHVWQGSFFRLEDHLDRFQRSCEKLRLDPGLDRNALREILMECVRRLGERDAYVEVICTRGVPSPGSRDPRLNQNRFIAFALPFIWVMTPEHQERGGHLIISDIPRISPRSIDPTVKNFNWADMNRGLFDALDRGGDTVVMLDMDGNISEGPGFNVFCLSNGRITTPGGTVLEGITRASVRELCEEAGVPFELGTVSPDELRDADEVFLSSTAGGILPITKIDERILSNGAPGPITMRLRERYWSKHDEGWHATPVNYDR